MTNVIDGTKIAQEILVDLKKKIAGQNIGLAAILAGDDPGLKKFVDLKRKAAQSIGIQFSSYIVDSQTALMETIAWLSKDTDVQGIFVELPLPEGYETKKILNSIPIEKDVDVLNDANEKVLPPAVQALKTLIEHEKIVLEGKTAAVFGQGNLVGKPIAHWLELQGVRVLRIDENTLDPRSYSLQGDLVVSGVGKPGLISADMVKDDAIVIDYGYGKKGKVMAGDVDFNNVAKKASLITPVPGGMGPLVVAAVLQNLVELVVPEVGVEPTIP